MNSAKKEPEMVLLLVDIIYIDYNLLYQINKMMTRRLTVLDIIIIIVLIIVAAIIISLLSPLVIVIVIIAAGYFIYRWYKGRSSL